MFLQDTIRPSARQMLMASAIGAALGWSLSASAQQHATDVSDEARIEVEMNDLLRQQAELIAEQNPAMAPKVMPGMALAAMEHFNVAGATMQALAFDMVEGVKRIQVSLGGRVRTIEIVPHSMRAVDCKFFINDGTGLQPIDPPPVTTYRGQLREEQNSQVYASIYEGQLRAMVVDQFGETWGIEPASEANPAFPADWHIVYHTADVLPAGDCGTDDRHFLQGMPEARPIMQLMARRGGGGEEEGDDGGLAGGAGDGRTQIGFDADFEYYQAKGNSTAATIAAIETIMNGVSGIYQTQMNGNDPICYELTGFIVRTSSADPYTSSNSGTLLCQFIGEWNNNVPDSSAGIPRDIGHLFTGRDLDGTIIGLAYIGVVCDFTFNISGDCAGFNNVKAHYGLSQEIANVTNRIQLTAHELGHNWNACHCNQSGCTGGAADPDCGIMFANINGSLTFGSRSRNAIDNYRDNTSDCLTTCLGTLYVNDNSLPFTCLGAQIGTTACWYTTVSAGYNAFHWAGGTMRIAPGTYLGSISFIKNSNVPMTIDRWANGESGSPVIGGN